MRVSSYLLLLFSFACGIAGSLFIAATFFWKKADAPRPTTMVPILVAKEDLPVGVELTAPLLRFERVAIDEIPTGALARFSDAVHHRTLYAIARDYPICRDMIAARQEPIANVNKFVPVGFRVVSLEVRQPTGSGDLLAPDQRLNLFVDTSDNPGRFAAMRSEIVGASPLKCILEGVLVQTVTDSVDSDGDLLHTVSLLLTTEQKNSLIAAASEGRLRVAIASAAEIPTEIPVETPETKVAATFTTLPPLPPLPEPVLLEPVLPEPAEPLPAPEIVPATSTKRVATFVTPSRMSSQHSETPQD